MNEITIAKKIKTLIETIGYPVSWWASGMPLPKDIPSLIMSNDLISVNNNIAARSENTLPISIALFEYRNKNIYADVLDQAEVMLAKIEDALTLNQEPTLNKIVSKYYETARNMLELLPNDIIMVGISYSFEYIKLVKKQNKGYGQT